MIMESFSFKGQEYIPLEEFSRQNSWFTDKELERINVLFAKGDYSAIFNMIEILKKEFKTKDYYFSDKLTFLVSRLAWNIRFLEDSTVLQDFVLNLWFNEVINNPKSSLLSRAIMRKDKLYYRSHIG